MLPESKIAKGKRMEEFVSKEIEEMGLGKSMRTPGSGSGNRFKGDLFNSIPFLIEVKNQKHLNWWQSITQAQKQAEIGNYDRNKWCLTVRDPRTPEANPEVYAVIDFWEFLSLLKKNKEPKIKKPDRELKWALENLKIAISRVNRML